jgi:hypothetical protein
MRIREDLELAKKIGIEHAYVVDFGRTAYRAVFTGRKGGFSEKPYHYMNLSPYVGDFAETVLRNRRLIAGYLGFDDFITVSQVHGTDFFKISERTHLSHASFEADGIITDLLNHPIGVLTADCIPFLFMSDNGISAAVHAGWRGLFGGILEEAVGLLREGGAEEVAVLAGPSISACCYEVSGELLKKAEELYPAAVEYIETRPHLNLKFIGLNILKNSGISENNIFVVDECTSCNNDIYYSYRKDKITGRQAGIVVRIR